MKTYKIKIDGKEYEVLGCPFCGKKPQFISWVREELTCNGARCFATRWGSSIAAAIKNWNKRAS